MSTGKPLHFNAVPCYILSPDLQYKQTSLHFNAVPRYIFSPSIQSRYSNPSEDGNP